MIFNNMNTEGILVEIYFIHSGNKLASDLATNTTKHVSDLEVSYQ